MAPPDQDVSGQVIAASGAIPKVRAEPRCHPKSGQEKNILQVADAGSIL